MIRKSIAIAVAAAALAASSIPAYATAPSVHERAVEAAQKGPEALRRFIERTRMIYALNFHDYYRAE
jgi:hypothetical protein